MHEGEQHANPLVLHRYSFADRRSYSLRTGGGFEKDSRSLAGVWKIASPELIIDLNPISWNWGIVSLRTFFWYCRRALTIGKSM